jgi:class 3 adenylate cyclase
MKVTIMLSLPTYSTSGRSLIDRNAHPIAAESTCATVLVVELRGYGALAERLAPLQLVPLLGEFFALFRCAVLQHGGQVFRCTESGGIAAFGVCDSCHTHSDDALSTATAIERSFAALRAAWQTAYSIPTGVAAGIHRGEVAIGLFAASGLDMPMLVGDAVNVAIDLCARARVGEILLSGVAKTADPQAPDAHAGAVAATRSSLSVTPQAAPAMLHFPRLKLPARQACMDVWCVPLVERPEMHHPWDYARRGDHMDLLETIVA